jgi:hypothetical protein
VFLTLPTYQTNQALTALSPVPPRHRPRFVDYLSILEPANQPRIREMPSS